LSPETKTDGKTANRRQVSEAGQDGDGHKFPGHLFQRPVVEIIQRREEDELRSEREVKTSGASHRVPKHSHKVPIRFIGDIRG
jgi:hypothetical protein